MRLFKFFAIGMTASILMAALCWRIGSWFALLTGWGTGVVESIGQGVVAIAIAVVVLYVVAGIGSALCSRGTRT